MTRPNAPSANKSNYNSMAGMMREVLSTFLQNVDDMLPAKVISYDRTTNRAQVQPLIMLIKTDETIQARAPVASIPVMQIGGGGFVMSFPIAAGDIGWIKANDRDISLFIKSFTQVPPNTYRKHNFSDAVFIPDTMLRGVTLASEDKTNGNLVVQNYAGTVKIAWWATFLKIIAPRIGIGGSPNANAILDIQSTTKAFMMPRMTQTQRDAIPSPTEGMQIWNLTTHGVSSYNGTIWS